MMLAALSPGQTVVMGRDIHLSAVWGLVTSGAVPRFLPLRFEDGVPMPAEPDGSEPVLTVRPNYFGLCSSLTGGRVQLVDEAWGGHFGFDTSCPASAMQSGADLSVTSAHKMLTALSGSALLFGRGDQVDPERLRQAVMAVSTTSPYYGTWVSIEATVDQMARRGGAMVRHAVQMAERLRTGLGKLSQVRLPSFSVPTDPLHVLFGVEGWSGYGIEQALLRRGIAIEMATPTHVLVLVGLSIREADVDALVRTVSRLGRGDGERSPLPWTTAESRMTPREAFFAKQRRVALADAIGSVAAEPVAAYPPGIPLLIPGDIVNQDVVSVLGASVAAGARVLGNGDPTMQTLQIVA